MFGFIKKYAEGKIINLIFKKIKKRLEGDKVLWAIKSWLSGKKTYLAAISAATVLVVDVINSYITTGSLNEAEIAAALGALGLGAMRAGIAKAINLIVELIEAAKPPQVKDNKEVSGNG